MKNNLHTELRKEWVEFNEEMSFTTPEERDIIADWWLQKLDELTHDTLEGLIEKCGEEFGKLIRNQDDKGVFWKAWGYHGRGIKITDGSTPRIATQNLLKALTKKG